MRGGRLRPPRGDGLDRTCGLQRWRIPGVEPATMGSASMVKLVDTADLKSAGFNRLYRFDPGSRHHQIVQRSALAAQESTFHRGTLDCGVVYSAICAPFCTLHPPKIPQRIPQWQRPRKRRRAHGVFRSRFAMCVDFHINLTPLD